MENLVALDLSYSAIECFDVSSNNPLPPTKRQKHSAGSSSKERRLLGSLKILDLSFSEQLQSVGGFFELPSLERLIVTKCISLIEVCESVEHCVELVHVDLSYCDKLKKLPVSIVKLKKVKTLVLDGCSSLDLRALDTSMTSQSSSYNIMETMAIPSDLKFFTISIPCSLTTLSLANSNMSNESFPMDMSFLFLLEELRLDSNPIVAMPDCVRTLPRLQRLYMDHCYKLESIEHPPQTLRLFSIDRNSFDARWISGNPLSVQFHPEMPAFNFLYDQFYLVYKCPLEIEGVITIQAMSDIEENVLSSLGWTNLEFIKDKHVQTHLHKEVPTQMFYEFGIFYTFYEGKEMPKWISSHRSKKLSISFTMPSSTNLRGLNLYSVEKSGDGYFWLPNVKICNTTKSFTWTHHHFCPKYIKLRVECLIWLSHWMFGPNEMKAGDKITITLQQNSDGHARKHALSNNLQETVEWGIGFVYDDGKSEEEDDDALGYYKSWNHIIGGDLSRFQITTGEYVLSHSISSSYYWPFDDDRVKYKEDRQLDSFKPFSRKKSRLSIEEVE